MSTRENKINPEHRTTISRLNSINETSLKLRAGRNKIYKLIQSGELAAIKIGSSTFITNEEIDNFIDAAPKFPVEPALRKRQQTAAA